MGRWTHTLWHKLFSGWTAARRAPIRRARLQVEHLETRTVLSTANASGTLTGAVFLDANHNGTLDKGELTMPGVKVVLTGTVSATTAAVSATTTTNTSGTYTFANVLPGTYEVIAGPVSGLIDSTTPTASISSIGLSGGQTLSNNLALTGMLSPSALTLALFLTQTVSVGHAFGPVSTAADPVNPRPDNAPTVSTAIANQTVNINAADTHLDLAGNFTDPDYTDSQVTFNITDGTTPEKLVLDLFDAQDPQTVANFFDYINSGAYNNAIFTRLVTSGIDILQGGAVALAPNGTTQTITLTNAVAGTTQFTLTFAGATTTPIAYSGTSATDIQNIENALIALNTVDGTAKKGGTVTVTEQSAGVFTITFGGTLAHAAQPQLSGNVPAGTATLATSIVTMLNSIPIVSAGDTGVPSEFPTATSPPAQNVAGTIAMALSGSPSDPNSGTNQFFFNIGDNSSSLDSQKFTTFGKIESISTATVNTLGATPTQNVSNATLTSEFPSADFQNIPLKNYKGTSATFPADATPGNFVTINSVTVNKREEFLTYSVVSNSDSSLVTPTVTNEWLTLHYANGQSGTATIVVKATDKYGASVTQSFTVTVNGPSISGVSFTDDDPSNTNVTTLTANPASTDSQNQQVTYSYQWLQNGQAIAGATSQTLALSSVAGLAAGDTLSVTVTPKDTSAISGAPFTSQAVTVAKINPFTLKLPTVSSVAIATDATSLTATPTSPADPLGQTISYSYQWLQNNQPIADATGQTLQLSSVTVQSGDALTVQVTPSDGVLTGTTFSSAIASVTGTNPTQIVVAPTISAVGLAPSSPQTTDTLTANVTATDPQNQPLTYTYVWTDVTTGDTLQTTPDTTSPSDLLDLTSSGVSSLDTVQVTVTANNGVLNSTPAMAQVRIG
jgi:cyclophilin family peptidyl-prolyl cis-trans isomerase